MSIAIVTGSGGLVGAETVKAFGKKNLSVVGIDNNMRKYFFGEEASTAWQVSNLKDNYSNYAHYNIDIRDESSVNSIFSKYGKDISVIIHCAAQPSHDWAAKEPITDFTVNANGTLVLLEATRKFAHNAPFIFVSTNKVYGDRPNHFPLDETETRFELSSTHPWAKNGFPEELSIDDCLHSVFGASKVAADILVQEYGRYFGLKTACFRGGCLTGPGHSGAELHGFLAYLVKCAVSNTPYTVFGYKGKQVRDNIHSEDLVEAFWHFFQAPSSGKVYNIGGGRHSNCSMLEAIKMAEVLTGRQMNYKIVENNRIGDHIWWISDTSKFQCDYPQWGYKHDISSIIKDIHYGISERLDK